MGAPATDPVGEVMGTLHVLSVAYSVELVDSITSEGSSALWLVVYPEKRILLATRATADPAAMLEGLTTAVFVSACEAAKGDGTLGVDELRRASRAVDDALREFVATAVLQLETEA